MLAKRLGLYRRLEAARGRPLIVYVTSARLGVHASIAADVVPELMTQLNALPEQTDQLDLLLVSNGGDPTVAWRIVSLIRERVSKFSVLVPQAAYSAATLIALGANEIVIHPNGNLGPTDPQIRSPKRNSKDSDSQPVGFGSEDLSAFLKFARDEVGLNDQAQMLSVFNHFCEEVGSVAVGVAARSAQLLVSMGEKLLQLHMDGESKKAKARSISQTLTSNYFHHGYAVSRKEAKDIELPVADKNAEVERLMWDIWLDISDELKLREPFNPVALLRADPDCAPLFAPSVIANIPTNLPQAAQQQAITNLLNQVGITSVPAVKFEVIYSMMESARLASRCESAGLVFASRLPDLQIRISTVCERQGWVDVPASTAANSAKRPAKVAKVPQKRAQRRNSQSARLRASSQINARKGRVRVRRGEVT